jgi:hypothetical protein
MTKTHTLKERKWQKGISPRSMAISVFYLETDWLVHYLRSILNCVIKRIHKEGKTIFSHPEA